MRDFILLTCLSIATAIPVSQYNNDCGVPDVKPVLSQFIVGGLEANPNSWPWMVSLKSSSNSHFCGGTLVRKNSETEPYAVVTAAHCIGSQQINVVLGMHDQLSTANTQTFSIPNNRRIIHPGYLSSTYENDIAILRLPSVPTINQYVKPACIASANHTGGMDCTVTGWGTTSSGGTLARRLRQVTKPIVDNDSCARAYSAYGYDKSTMMCAGLYQQGGGKDSCQGDSGGPLHVLRNGRYELTGVVSWGVGCALEAYPGVYADVYQLTSWLSENGIY